MKRVVNKDFFVFYVKKRNVTTNVTNMISDTLFSADKLPVAVHSVDIEGRLIYVNKAWLDFFGWKKKEVIGKQLSEFLTEESRKRFEVSFHNFLKHDRIPKNEYEVIKKDGTRAFITADGNVWRERRNGADVINAIIHDVTARREAEQRVSLLEIMLEQSIDPMIVLDEDANIKDANVAATSTLGYTHEELTKLRVMDIDPVFTEDMWKEHWERAKNTDRYKLETVHKTKSGGLIDVEVVGSYFEHEGRGYKCSVSRDITARKSSALKSVRQLDVFKALYELGLKMTGRAELVESLSFILESCCKILGADVSFIALINENRKELEVASSYGEISELLQGLHIPVDKGLGGKVLESGTGIIIEDYPGDEKINIEMARVVEAEKAVSGMAAPLSADGKKKGVLYAFKRTKGAFDADSLETLTLFGNLAAAEINKSGLRKQLDESQKRLSDIFEFLPDATLAVDRNGNVMAWNRAIEEMTGLRKRDVLGKGKDEYASAFYSDGRSLLVDFIVADNWEVLNNYNFVKIQGENVVTEVYVEKVYGGRGAYLWIMAAPLRDAEGRVIGGLECIRDVTDRRRAEESLREGEARFKAIVTNSPNATVLADSEGVVTYVSPQYETITGYPPETVIGSVFPDYIFPEDREKAMEAAAKLLVDKREVKDFECRFFNIENQIKWVSLSAKVIMLGDVSIGYQCTISDITEKKKSEAALKESEARFKAIVTNSPNITILTNPEGKAIYVSPQFEAMTGFPFSAILGMNIFTKLRPDQNEEVLEYILNATIEKKEILGLESHFLNADKKLVWVSVSGALVRFGDTFMGYQFTVTNITDQKGAAEALRESEARFKTIVTNSPNITILADTDGIITYASPQYEMITGYKAKDLIGKSIPEFVHPEDKPKLSELWNKVVYDNLALLNYEYRYYNSENQLRWISLSAKAITDGEKVIGFQYTGEDVTGKKQAAEALKESEARFRAIVMTSPNTTVLTDPQGRIIYASPQHEENTGYPVEAVIGKFFPGSVHPDDAGMLEKNLKKALAEGDVVKKGGIEFRHIRSDGKVKWASLFANVMKVGGNILGFQYTMTDITEKKKAEESLKESEERFRMIVLNSPDMTYTTDEDGNVMFVSPQCEDVIGHPASKIIGLQFPDFIHPEDLDMCMDKWKQAMVDGKEVNDVEYRIIDGEGKTRWISHSARLIKVDEKIIGSQSLIRNITRRVERERELKENEEKYRQLVEHANSIILRLDTEGKITFFNEYAESLLGFSREEIIGKYAIGTVVPETESSGRNLKRIVNGIMSNPEMYARNENENMRKDGTRLWVAWSNKGIFDDKGNLIGIHCIGNDITNIKNVEAALRRSEEELKALSQNLIRTEENERRRLSREIHDELGQQLAIMSLELEWLNGLGDEFQYAENIRRLANLVEDMSVTTRSICEGLRPPVIDEAGLPSTVEYLVGRFREATSIKTILTMNIEGVSVTPEIAITVFRILQESLTNIIKYARADDVSVMLIRDADELILAVRDNGVGFPLDRATNGLGILGMRERSEAVGGTLAVESEVGKGTMVFMRVPVKSYVNSGGN